MSLEKVFQIKDEFESWRASCGHGHTIPMEELKRCGRVTIPAEQAVLDTFITRWNTAVDACMASGDKSGEVHKAVACCENCNVFFDVNKLSKCGLLYMCGPCGARFNARYVRKAQPQLFDQQMGLFGDF